MSCIVDCRINFIVACHSKVSWWQQWFDYDAESILILSPEAIKPIWSVSEWNYYLSSLRSDKMHFVIYSFHRVSPETELVIVQRVAILFAETRDRQQNGITNFENRIWTSLCSTRPTTNFPLKILIRNRTDQRGLCQL